MLGGPLFQRECLTAPRQAKHFFLRAGYIAALFVLIYTARQTIFSWQSVRTIGDAAGFGGLVFNVLAVVQLTLVLAAALLFCSGNIAQEKDRRTLILLLMTDLKDRELVGGKLLASLLSVATLIGVSLPVFCFLSLLGGVGLDQILWFEALCIASALAAGTWGTLVAMWREKTFQTLAITVLGAVLWVGMAEGVVAVTGNDSVIGQIASACDPFRTLGDILNPLGRHPELDAPGVSAAKPVGILLGLSAFLFSFTVLRLRIWNPSRSIFEFVQAAENEDKTVVDERAHARVIWNNPIIWREICTRAYGKRVIFIKLAYFVLAGFALIYLSQTAGSSGLVLGLISREAFVFLALSLMSLLLINAQAVTALTNEKDGQTLELLLVTNVTAQEFVFGKLGGIFYNAKEVFLVPLLFLIKYQLSGSLAAENAFYVFIGYFTLAGFSAMLGMHSGLSHDRSRTAIANSLGTIFFLFIGMFICMMLMVEARASFAMQFAPFLLFILGGSLGLWASLTHRNPSPALTLAAGLLPFCTFYAITGFLLGNTLGVCLFVAGAYGFTALAMLIPAVSEFDVALGRSGGGKG